MDYLSISRGVKNPELHLTAWSSAPGLCVDSVGSWFHVDALQFVNDRLIFASLHH